MAFLSINTTVESKAKDPQIVPLKDGQFLIITDAHKLMYDNGEDRITFCDIIDLENDDERTGLLAPLDKFYYVKSPGVLWRHSGDSWQSIGGSGGGGSGGGDVVISKDEPEDQEINGRWLEILS